MRTKTLALSAMLGALGAASAIAQTNVYSINAVGYINVVLNPGFNMIACQLTTTNNTLGALFNNSTGIYNGSKIFKWSTGIHNYLEDSANSATASYSNGWLNGGTVTMNPGEALWFDNGTGHVLTNTFVGTVPQGTNTVPIVPGFNMISSPVPFSGDIVTNMGLTNYNNHDRLYVFSNPAPGFPAGNYSIYSVSFSTGSSGYMGQWSTPDPSANVGQGFWYDASSPGLSWVQIFEINP
jgi:hypothetical protein